MNFAQLRAFHAIATHGGFSAAAQALGVSQPAITQHVKALEEAVGALLTPIAPAFAQRGDIGAIAAGNGLILVVVEGDTIGGPGPTRFRRLPRRMLVRAWRAM